jgi:hypothetical protein
MHKERWQLPLLTILTKRAVYTI